MKKAIKYMVPSLVIGLLGYLFHFKIDAYLFPHWVEGVIAIIMLVNTWMIFAQLLKIREKLERMESQMADAGSQAPEGEDKE